jgi:hypothetical protein
MKCSAAASTSNSSTLKNSSCPLSVLSPDSTMLCPAGDQWMPLTARLVSVPVVCGVRGAWCVVCV